MRLVWNSSGELLAALTFFWGKFLVYLCLSAGIWFSIRMRHPQLRLIKDMVVQLFGGKRSQQGVSSFQGFAMAIGGRVGTGNITGVNPCWPDRRRRLPQQSTNRR